MVMPVFFMVLFGVIDYGGAFRDYLTVNYLLQRGGRAAANAVNNPDADYTAVSQMAKAGGALPARSLQRVVIWRATDDGSGSASHRGPGSVVPPGCQVAGVGNSSDVCNVYSRAAGTLNPSRIDEGLWSSCSNAANPGRFWCPTARKSAAQGPGGPPDHLGIYVEVVHPLITGAFGSTLVIRQHGVFALESTTLQ